LLDGFIQPLFQDIGSARKNGRHVMAKVTGNVQRQAWTTPVLRRIRAGSAETVDNTGNADGPAGGNQDKS
jgi:hypothetical protein